jgi:hypothetical protein
MIAIEDVKDAIDCQMDINDSEMMDAELVSQIQDFNQEHEQKSKAITTGKKVTLDNFEFIKVRIAFYQMYKLFANVRFSRFWARALSAK